MKWYTAATILVALLSLFLVGRKFDRHTTHVRRIVLIAVMTSLSIIGRFLFAAVPGFKPMTAIIVLAGMYLGKESGFLCGSFTALISNFYFGQGPWTPFQMLAFGMIGYGSGLFEKSLKKSKPLLCVSGVFAGVLYSLIMDVWTVLWYNEQVEFAMLVASIGTALPFTIMYAISNIIFLLLLRDPFGKKLNRIVKKYGV